MKPRTSLPILLLLLLLPPVAAAQEAGVDEDALGPNVRVTLTIGDTDAQAGFRERHYRVITRHGTPTDLLMGWRTPIPSKRHEVTADGNVPVTAYTYQNVGVTGQIEVELVGGRILTRLRVEVSGPKAEAAAAKAPPVIGTFQEQLVVLLTDGNPLRVAEVPDHEGGSLYLEVTADILE